MIVAQLWSIVPPMRLRSGVQATTTGAKAVPIPLLEKNGFAFSAEDVLSRITPRTRLIIITSPHNPSGVVADPAALDEIGRMAAAHGAHVLVDEVYLDVTSGGDDQVAETSPEASSTTSSSPRPMR